uniref:Uncharacterized protein n=1 Tax=Sphenodon punctatus TaxID=8508 RepID=A0A8D0H4X1_SPHPU
MNPVNATALYISASRLVLNYGPGDGQSLAEIGKLLPYFRQSLSCCVCGEALSIVLGPGRPVRPPACLSDAFLPLLPPGPALICKYQIKD